MILCGLVLTRSLVVRRKANKLKQSLKQFPNKLNPSTKSMQLAMHCCVSFKSVTETPSLLLQPAGRANEDPVLRKRLRHNALLVQNRHFPNG